MPICAILKWYMPDNPRDIRDKRFPINSVVEGSITLIEAKTNGKDTYRVRIVTNELEKSLKCFECAVKPYARKVLEYEAKYQPKGKPARHYGLIVLRPGLKLKDSIVMDFISYHRHPTTPTTEPTACRYGISAYNEVFETRTSEENALKNLGEPAPKKLDERDSKKATQGKKKAIRKVLKEVIPQVDVEVHN